MPAPDVERILVREALLELASPRLSEAVDRCAKQMPMEDIAGFVEGDGKRASRVAAGPREAIAEVVRNRFPRGQVDHIAAMVNIREPGLMPCAFAVRLSGGSIDVSVIALRMERTVGERDVPAAGTPQPTASPEDDERIAAYTRERDAVLLDPDLNRLRAHLAKWGRPDALRASDEVMRAAWHKGRSGARSLPREERRKSARWLEEKGMSHFAGDGVEEPN